MLPGLPSVTGLAALVVTATACGPPPAESVGAGAGGAGAGSGGAGTDSGGARSVPSPWIFAGELENARDVGGLPSGSGARVAHGVLFRGPPLRLSVSGCDEFAALGIRTVIDLRIESEQTAPPACVSDRAGLVLAPLPVPYNVSPADYVAIVQSEASVARVFRTLGEPESYPVYTHCTWGRDRTGVLIGLILRALGVPGEAILQEYLLSEESVGAFPVSLQAALDEVERRGGIGPYLRGIGVTEAQIAELREHALEPLPP